MDPFRSTPVGFTVEGAQPRDFIGKPVHDTQGRPVGHVTAAEFVNGGVRVTVKLTGAAPCEIDPSPFARFSVGPAAPESARTVLPSRP
ncbi:MAG: hypothetical protein EKK55_13545 [Rhodocyclaceae bacterium]|nr:MAG: hypothetical protein EKK55_13545 [Rhodocyclaceae bacterium]